MREKENMWEEKLRAGKNRRGQAKPGHNLESIGVVKRENKGSVCIKRSKFSATTHIRTDCKSVKRLGPSYQ